ncbi:hypothetical protein B1H29_17120 [Streptomyces pactum]|uniref:Type I restriction enzyme HindI endonuclease subunit-like C-terminal domain-containing protein n=2 Tax=Streptomyces pactum TaxID=68249 RepID=A0A1S6J9L2_9ACTN|nr:hypothetical protein B1H29_17120 [Streptomyces pactum]
MCARVTKHNVVRNESFADRLDHLMRRYMRQQLTSARAIAELAAPAREVWWTRGAPAALSATSPRGTEISPDEVHRTYRPPRQAAWRGVAPALVRTCTPGPTRRPRSASPSPPAPGCRRSPAPGRATTSSPPPPPPVRDRTHRGPGTRVAYRSGHRGRLVVRSKRPERRSLLLL